MKPYQVNSKREIMGIFKMIFKKVFIVISLTVLFLAAVNGFYLIYLLK